MIYAEYGLTNGTNHSLVMERPDWDPQSIRERKNATLLAVLEEEIRLLRAWMELAYREHQSFTADFVVDISRALDDKLNEYMKLKGDE